MRVPANQFPGDGLGNILKVKIAVFAGQMRMKNNLEQQIAKLIPQLPHIAVGDRIRDVLNPRLQT